MLNKIILLVYKITVPFEIPRFLEILPTEEEVPSNPTFPKQPIIEAKLVVVGV